MSAEQPDQPESVPAMAKKVIAGWNSGLFSCFGNWKVCLLSCFLPNYLHAKVAEGFGEDFMLCFYNWAIPCAYCYSRGYIRQKVRKAKGIPGSFVVDLAMNVCCGCCTVGQEYLEMGLNPQPFLVHDIRRE